MATTIVDHLNDIEASYERQPGPLSPVEIPTSLTIQTGYGTTDEFSIHSWDERVEKSRCFDLATFELRQTLRKNWVPTSKSSPVFGVISV